MKKACRESQDAGQLSAIAKQLSDDRWLKQKDGKWQGWDPTQKLLPAGPGGREFNPPGRAR